MAVKTKSSVSRDNRTEEKRIKDEDRFTCLYNSSKDAIKWADLDGMLLDINDAFCKLTGYSKKELLAGKKYQDMTPKEYHDYEAKKVEKIIKTGKPEEYEKEYIRKDGSRIPILLTVFVVKRADGKTIGVAAIIKDITERKKVEQRLKQQTQEILELSTPVMQIWEGVVIAPLIGTLDSRRTLLFMERLLNTIVETNSQVALVDITGVPTIDTQTAQNLLETISAAQLLGAQVVLTGVRPAIAQTLVHLGIDLSDINTRSSLSAGLRVALDTIGDSTNQQSPNQ